MREIKFRAWDKDNKEMFEPVIPFGDSVYKTVVIDIKEDRSYLAKIKNAEIMQFTGLKDKNDKEIYEGDVVKCKMHNKTYENYVISWCSEDASFEALNVDKSNFIDATIWCKCEIIGNIHENPELAEVQE